MSSMAESVIERQLAVLERSRWGKSVRSLLVDMAAGVLLLTAFNAEWTGGTLHEWVGLAGVSVMTIHLLRHAKWVRGVARRLLVGRLALRSWLRVLLAVCLFLSLMTLLWSGLALSSSVSQVVGVGGGESEGWKTVHETTANAAGLLVIAHIALHQRWLRATGTRIGRALRIGA